MPTTTRPSGTQRRTRAWTGWSRTIQNTAEAYLARYGYRTRYGLADAETDLERALQLAPEDSGVLLTAATRSLRQAQALRRTGGDAELAKIHLDEARRYYEELTQRPPEEQVPAYFLGLGDTCLALEDFGKAVSTWQEGYKRFTQPTVKATFQARIADAYLDRNLLSEATAPLDAVEKIVDRLGSSVSRDERLAMLRAQDLRRATWRIKRGEIAEAVPLLRQVIVTQPKGDADTDATVQAWLMLGAVYGSLGEWLDAAAAFDQAASMQPNMQRARVAAAGAWLSARRPDMAIERAEQALALESTLEAWLTLAMAQLQQQAVRPPADRSWTRLEEALAVLERAKDRIETAPWRIDFLRADYLLAKAKVRGDLSEGRRQATELLKSIEQQHGERKELWIQLAMAYQSVQQSGEADRALAAYRTAGASAGEAALAESRLLSMRGEYGQAVRVLEAASDATPREREAFRGELLRLALAERDMAKARQMLLAEHRRQPQNVKVMQRLAELELEQRNFPAVEAWEKKLEVAGTLGEPLAGYYRAWRRLLTSKSDNVPELNAALRDMEQVLLLRPNWPEASSLRGMIHQQLGRIDQAVADYERAVRLGERRVLVFENLIALLDQLNRTPDVERYLARLEADIPLSRRLAEMAGEHEIRSDRPEQAVEIARKNVALRPNDPLAHLWLGRLLIATSEPNEAEHSLQKAVELAPADVRCCEALLTYYARHPNRDALEGVLARLAANDAMERRSKLMLLAQGNELLGNLEEARAKFEAAAQEAQDDLTTQLRVGQFHLQKDPAKAIGYLRRALEIDESSMAAKQMLAIALATQGEMVEAEKLLTTASADGLVATEDQRLHAILLTQQGGVANLARAVKLFESLTEAEATAQVSDRLLLARLYEQQSALTDDKAVADERIRSAREQLIAVASRPDANLTQIASVIQFLLRHRMGTEAQQWLAQLEQKVNALATPDANAMALAAQLQLQNNQPELALAWVGKLEKADQNPLRPLALRTQALLKQDAAVQVEPLVEARATELLQAASDDEKPRYIKGIGDIYNAAKQYAAAERWYRKLYAEDPKQYPLVVGALVRQDDLSSALKLCEEAAKEGSPLQAALVAASALVEGTPQGEHFKRTEPLLQAALKEHANDARLLYAVGLVRVVEGKDAESVDLFRKVVELNPRYVPALNNLALLLAENPTHREEALRLIDQAIEVAGKDAALLDSKGAILLYSGRSKEAVTPLEASIRGPEADPRHHFHLAVAYHDQGKVEEAKAQLKNALERQLEAMVLTPTDQKLLRSLRTALALETGGSAATTNAIQ
jgi:tetratricopeptide (TPR) repeat protein